MMFEADENGIWIKKARKDVFERAFGAWSDFKGDSVEYVRKIREGSEKRRKRLGL